MKVGVLRLIHVSNAQVQEFGLSAPQHKLLLVLNPQHSTLVQIYEQMKNVLVLYPLILQGLHFKYSRRE